MSVIAFDRRASHFVESRGSALDAWDDVQSLAAESRTFLERAHEAHVSEDWTGYLHSITAINDRLTLIRTIARDRKGAIQQAVTVPVDQIQAWTRPDGAVATEAATAA